MSLRKLPLFKGYTVDIRLKQFRKVDKKNIRFIDFDSVEGEQLLVEYIETLDDKSKEPKELIKKF